MCGELAQHYRACFAPAPHHGGIRLGHMVFQHARMARGGDPRRFVNILMCHGDSIKWPTQRAGCLARFRRLCLFQRDFRREADEGMQRRVQLF